MTTNDRENSYLAREKLKQQIAKNSRWYFIIFLRNLPSHALYSFTLFNEPFVLFKNKYEELVCYSLSSPDEIHSCEVMIKKRGEIWIYPPEAHS